MESYVSCIKIRGTPILPPLMTDDRRMEMNYYKKLALAVENKLKKLKITDNTERQKSNNNIKDSYRINNDETSDIYINADQQSNTNIIVPMTISMGESKINSESTDGGCKTNSDDETNAISTDINNFTNISDSSKTDVTETISDFTKPNVPKTLDIIPITVDTANIPKSSKSSSEMEESEEEVSKLVRQGSYTLETPSPMLLAHLEEYSNENYVPTTIVNGVKRRESNMTNARCEWKYQRKTPDSVKRYCSSEHEISSRVRRNSVSGSENKSVHGSFELQLPNTRRHVVRSVDCIPAIFSRENPRGFSRDNKKNVPMKKYRLSSGHSNLDNQKLKTNKDISNINLANKFGGSLGTLNNQTSPSNKKVCELNNSRMTKSFDASSTLNCELGYSPGKLKPVISEKLIHVFKEIQKTHELQMADLMVRQQKEQIMMQQEFQKQQLLLLSKIDESFPGMALPLLTKKITALPIDNQRFEGQKYSPHNSTSLLKSEQYRSDPETSPINGSSFETDESISINFKTAIQEQTELDVSCEMRKSNVSRELFPLESNTIHVSITNGIIYEHRHIEAATIINAYARGYFVRRLMKTERVITLKNTYQEALHYMLKLHVDAPLDLAELNFHKRLQHQCDAASISIVELFALDPIKRMEIIAQDRQIKKARQGRPSSARSSYSFATQRTLARKKFKELGITHMPDSSRSSTATARTRCQTWTSNSREKRSSGLINQGIKRSTSAGAVRKPWR